VSKLAWSCDSRKGQKCAAWITLADSNANRHKNAPHRLQPRV